MTVKKKKKHTNWARPRNGKRAGLTRTDLNNVQEMWATEFSSLFFGCEKRLLDCRKLSGWGGGGGSGLSTFFVAGGAGGEEKSKEKTLARGRIFRMTQKLRIMSAT